MFLKGQSVVEKIIRHNALQGFLNTVFRASERCHQEKRKTINGEDILFAMSTLGFDSYVEPLKQYLQKYREVRVAQNEIYSQQKKFIDLDDNLFLAHLN